MIDNSAQVDWLLSKLEAALPLTAHIMPELAKVLRGDVKIVHVPVTCGVTEIYYTGDEGGIVCKLDLGPEAEKLCFVSITHLRFDARCPLARDIAAYQKHRNKRIRRLAPTAFNMART